jgi:hypothetical protein
MTYLATFNGDDEDGVRPRTVLIHVGRTVTKDKKMDKLNKIYNVDTVVQRQ